jgi:hypothetical protein
LGRKLNLPMDEICERYLTEDISTLNLGIEYGVCETTILKYLKRTNREDVLAKINKNKNIKLEGGCEICGRNKRLKRLEGIIYCEAHYKQIKTHGEIVSEYILKDGNKYTIKDNYIEVDIIGFFGEAKGKTYLSLNRLDIVEKYKFHLRGNYIGITVNGNVGYLHKFLMNPEESEVVDHINRNPFDNRDENLRVCTQSENVINRGLQKNNTSGVRGVAYDKSRDRWIAQIGINNKNIYLGSFANKDDAIKARLIAEEKYFSNMIIYKGDEFNGSSETEL